VERTHLKTAHCVIFSAFLLLPLLVKIFSTAGPRLVKSHNLLSYVGVGNEASYSSKLTGFIFRLPLKSSSLDGMVESTEFNVNVVLIPLCTL
jgi:hypothetical protein